MEFQFSPFVYLNILAAVLSAYIAIQIWRRRPGPGVNAFVLMMTAVTIWALGSTIELVVTTISAKIFFLNAIYIGIVTVPTAWFVFALAYTGYDKWLTPRNITLLSIFPIVTFLVVITNPLHNQFWTLYTLASQTQDGLIVVDYAHGQLFWIHTAYSYIMFLAGAIVLIRAVIRSPQLYRGQISLLLIGALLPFIGNILFLSPLNPLPTYIDLTSFSFIATGLTVGWALYRFRLMDIIPVAREIIVESMEDGIIVVDSANRIVDINQAARTILSTQDQSIMGLAINEVWKQESDFIAHFQDKETSSTEVELTVAGEAHTYNVKLSPLKNRRGEITGRIATLHEITALKQINKDLKLARQKADEATQLKSDFLATMSHELRTPLNAVIGYSELMLTGMVGELSDSHYEYTDRVLSNANYLLGLINDILDISKIEAGRMELMTQPFNVREWADEIVTQHQVLADEKDIELKVTIDDQLPDIFLGDSARLRQIVINLLSNAFKFTHEGHVGLELRKQDSSTWSIKVSDTGIGIPPHKQETIFDEFQQVDGSTTREYGGTGLGLAIVRRFVRIMGGHIRLNSTLDEGSTFTIILPMLQDLPQTGELNAELVS